MLLRTLLAGLSGRPAALNLGGIANLTVPRPAGGGPPVAYDTGPGNALIDAAARRVTHGTADRDTDGRLAAAGRIDPDLLDRAVQVSGERTKKAAVTKALQEFIARREQRRVADLLGKLEWDASFDYKAERSRRK